MNKKELLQHIANQAHLTLKQAEAALNALVDGIRAAMRRQDTVSLPGFGQFGAKIRSPRKGRNPQTGEEMMIEQSVVSYFKAASALKVALNQEKDRLNDETP